MKIQNTCILKNIQGDVIGITDAAGNIEARYTYDSWGKLVSITDSEGNNVTENPDHISFINPIRYRGYYYDSETGLYYLNARYYDPETCRFLNADETLYGGFNIFEYCYNNPVNYSDPEGLYVRQLAVNYARRWSYERNPNYPSFSEETGDCANFVSQCLRAGGIRMNDEWYCCEGNLLDYIVSFWPDKGYKKWKFSNAWSVARDQYEYIKNNLSSGSYDIYNLDDIPYYANNCGIQIGDVMYLQWDRSYPHHATIISKIRNGMIYYAAHTDDHDEKPLSQFFQNIPGGSAHILKIRE